MNKFIVTPSLLGYLSNLKDNLKNIDEMISSGVIWMHIDVIRDPFIPNTNKFTEQDIKLLYETYGKKLIFDFHLMVQNPDKIISYINSIIPKNERGKHNITVHLEAYRDKKLLSDSNLDFYESKDYDLLNPKEEDLNKKSELTRLNNLFIAKVQKCIKDVKASGYMAGISLEPGTSIKNITKEIFSDIDLILLMAVSSGKSGQEFKVEVMDKIAEVKKIKNFKYIQIDGGVNDKTIQTCLDHGANNLVIGSYLTNSKTPGEIVRKILNP